MNHRSRPQPIAAALRAVRDRAQPPTPLAAVQAVWTDAVGDAIAAAARPVAERAGVVTVACSAATWAQELDLMRDELLARLSAALGDGAPGELRFVVDGGRYDAFTDGA